MDSSFCVCSFNTKQLKSNIISLIAVILQILLYPKFIYLVGFPSSDDKYKIMKYITLIFMFLMLIISIIIAFYDIKFTIKGINEILRLKKTYCSGKKIEKKTNNECENTENTQNIFNYINLFNNSIAMIMSIIIFSFIISSKDKSKMYGSLFCLLLFIFSFISIKNKSKLITDFT